MIKESTVKKITFILLIIAFIVLLLPVISLGFDYWWHLKTGNYILSHGTIPSVDPFSWYRQGSLPWVSHEWLSEVLLAVMAHLFGSYHVIFFCLFFLALSYFFLYYIWHKEMEKNILFSLGYLFLGVFIFGLGLLPRPHMISNFLFLVTLYLLFDYDCSSQHKRIYFLPVIAFLWANLHGGSSNLSYLLCLVFAVSNYINAKKEVGNTFLKVGLLSLFALLFNPQGITLLIYPYQNMGNHFMQQIITEWQPPSIFQVSHWSIFVLLISFVIGVIYFRKKIPLVSWILTILFSFLTLRSMRFAPYLYFLFGFVFFPCLSKKKVAFVTYPILSLACTFLICMTLFSNGKLAYLKTNQPLLDDNVIRLLKSEQPERLYNYYDYGGYLIYCDIPVFVDGRADVYSDYNLKDFYQLMNLSSGYENIIEKYQFDYYLIPKTIPLAQYLEDSSYEKLYDSSVCLYKKKSD